MTRTALAFRHPSIDLLDRFTIARFDNPVEWMDTEAYYDNIRVTADPAIAPVL